ncbi:MAG TPA: hypothetical protein VMM38_04350 [Aridibacter sp.]|nr:hypothetical protein [Aridibacter sp.]
MDSNAGPKVYLRALAVWVAIILAESIHGTLRTLFIEPAIGGPEARQISVLTGSILIFLVTLLFIRWIAARSARAFLTIGAMWVLHTVAFELALGRLVLGLPWQRILEDYDIANGGLMLFGLLFLLLSPLIASRVRNRGKFEEAFTRR